MMISPKTNEIYVFKSFSFYQIFDFELFCFFFYRILFNFDDYVSYYYQCMRYLKYKILILNYQS